LISLVNLYMPGSQIVAHVLSAIVGRFPDMRVGRVNSVADGKGATVVGARVAATGVAVGVEVGVSVGSGTSWGIRPIVGVADGKPVAVGV
jgi:hypothetical protein